MEIILPILILAIPVACIAWTVTHEELFRETHEYCVKRSVRGRSVFVRKFFYMLTCEYCFSHYVTIAILFLTHYQLLLLGWRGYVIAFFSITFIANIYMSLFAKIRIDIKKERTEIEQIEQSM